MDQADIDSLKNQIIDKRRHLNKLKERQARMHNETPTGVILDIEDLEAEIKELEAQLPQKQLAEVILDRDPAEFSEKDITVASRVFAAALGISEGEVTVTFLRAGSVVLLVQLPKEAMDKLISLHETDNPKLQGLMIQQIKIVENLANADLKKVDLRGFDFFDVDLNGANLSKAKLRMAKLNGAKLINASLNGASLIWADLRWADLRGAILNGASLNGASLNGADLRGASLNGASLKWTKLRTLGIVSLLSLGRWIKPRETDLSEAIYNKNTIWPKGFNPNKAGAILVNDSDQ